MLWTKVDVCNLISIRPNLKSIGAENQILKIICSYCTRFTIVHPTLEIGDCYAMVRLPGLEPKCHHSTIWFVGQCQTAQSKSVVNLAPVRQWPNYAHYSVAGALRSSPAGVHERHCVQAAAAVLNGDASATQKCRRWSKIELRLETSFMQYYCNRLRL